MACRRHIAPSRGGYRVSLILSGRPRARCRSQKMRACWTDTRNLECLRRYVVPVDGVRNVVVISAPNERAYRFRISVLFPMLRVISYLPYVIVTPLVPQPGTLIRPTGHIPRGSQDVSNDRLPPRAEHQADGAGITLRVGKIGTITSKVVTEHSHVDRVAVSIIRIVVKRFVAFEKPAVRTDHMASVDAYLLPARIVINEAVVGVVIRDNRTCAGRLPDHHLVGMKYDVVFDKRFS